VTTRRNVADLAGGGDGATDADVPAHEERVTLAMLGRERSHDAAPRLGAIGLGEKAIDRRSPTCRTVVDVIARPSHPSPVGGKKEAVVHRRGSVAAVELERTLPKMHAAHLRVADRYARHVDNRIEQRQLATRRRAPVENRGNGIGLLAR
jgi:hypothetical protein